MKINCHKSIITLTLLCSLGVLTSCGAPPAGQTEAPRLSAAEQTATRSGVRRTELICAPQQSGMKITKQPESMQQWSAGTLPSDWKELPLTDLSAALRVPAGWMLSPKVPGQFSYYWLCRAPERKDKTATTLLLAVITPPGVPTIEDGLRDTLHGIKRTRPNWSNTNPEWGIISGKPFLRSYWCGEAVASKIETTCGVTYVTVLPSVLNKKSLLILSAQDLKQYAGKTIPEVEKFIRGTVFRSEGG